MRDTIYREDAIEAVKSTKPIVRSTERNWGKMIAEQHSKELVKAIKALPSAEAVSREEYEALKAKWIEAEQRADYYDIDGDDEASGHTLPSAEAVQGWIPCSERLPSEDGRYLVCMNWEYDNMEVLKWADGWNCFRCPDGKVSRKSEIDREDVIAWMPLPKSYKGGEDE